MPTLITLILCTVVLINFARAQILTSSISIPSKIFDATVNINTATDMVDITMSGLETQWFSIGFGSQSMSGTYAVMASGANVVGEYKLTYGGGDQSGNVLSNMLTINSDSTNGGIRTVSFSRARVGDTNNHFTFPAVAGSVNIIWAVADGAKTTPGWHGGSNTGNRGGDSMTFSVAPSNSFETCITASLLTDVSIEIARNSVDETVKFTMTGPINKYFAYGFGGLIMKDTYTFVSSGSSESDIVARYLGQSSTTGAAGSINAFSSSTTVSVSNDGSKQTVEIIRPWSGAETGAYDFEPLMKCTVNTLDMIAAMGSDLTYRYHGYGNKATGRATSLCCTASPTSNPTSNPTSPGATQNPTINPVTISPTVNPVTMSPTANPVTSNPTTSLPTITPDADFETCVNSNGVIIGRNIADETVKITITNEADRWFAAGFGDRYTITSNGTLTDAIVGRRLGASTTPQSLGIGGKLGTVVPFSSDTEINLNVNGNTQSVVIIRPWNDGVSNSYDFTPLMQCTETTIDMITAEGNTAGLTFGYHFGARTSGPETSLCTCDGVTSAPSVSPTTEPPTVTAEGGCATQDALSATADIDGVVIVKLDIDCQTNVVSVNMTFTEYDENWFGIVFSKTMTGTSLIWTTGTDGSESSLGVYQHTNTASRQVIRDEGDSNVWTEVSRTIDGENLNVVISQNAADSFIDINQELQYLRYAKGSSGFGVGNHGFEGRSDGFVEINIFTGETTEVEDDLTLIYVHGMLMWIAWSLLSSFGVMSSAFRYLYPQGPKWFKAHRGVQIAVVVIGFIAFILAVAFVGQKGGPHFGSGHQIGGLIVTIFAILQPINAYFRPHPPSDGWKDGVKPTARVVWEYVHKGFGYFTWVLSLFVCMAGFFLIGNEVVGRVQIVWIILVLITYIGLSATKYMRQKKENEVDGTNAGIAGDTKQVETVSMVPDSTDIDSP